MPNTILVVAEQREGKLNRVSFETIAAAQSIAKETGWAVEVVLPGNNLSTPAAELASQRLRRLMRWSRQRWMNYTADGYVHALKHFVADKQPKLVLFPHTYQVRDFAPRLALALGQALISDGTGYKYESGKLLFTRQMFQGKFAADVSFTGEGPWMATIQIGAFRGDQAESGSSPVETIAAATAETAPRVIPHEVFQEAKQAVDLEPIRSHRRRRPWHQGAEEPRRR